MQKYFSASLLLIIALILSLPCQANGNTISEVNTIDQYDTVYFGLANAILTSDFVQIPVFIKSDDEVHSLDFALKYDLTKLQYDSLIVYNTGMNPTANYNGTDSTLRLTSFDLQPIYNSVNLIALRFKRLTTGTVTKADLHPVSVQLNGEMCTPVILDQTVATEVSQITNGSFAVNVFPNPVAGILNIRLTEDAMVKMFDLYGHQVIPEIILRADHIHSLNTLNIPAGNYLIEAVSKNSRTLSKVIVIN